MMIPTILSLKKRGVDFYFLTKNAAASEVVGYFNDCGEFLELDKLKGGRVRRFFFLVKWIFDRKVDISISQYGVNSAQYSLLVFLAGVKKRLGWQGPLSFLNTLSLRPEGAHKVIENARFLDFIAGVRSGFDLGFGSSSINDTRINKIVIGPGSGILEAHKRWSAEKYAELSRLIASELALPVFVIGGPEEKLLCDDVANNSGSSLVKSVAGELSISETMDFIKDSSLVVANCNGISHLASSVDVPIVGLYGPTNYRHTGPYSKKLKPISVEMECSPCYRRGYISGCGNPVCMESITVHQVFSEIKKEVEKLNG